ncbi:hypothetical protein L9F63_003931, partial [Diploptera punctata]
LSGHPRVVWPPQGCLATPGILRLYKFRYSKVDYISSGLSGHPRYSKVDYISSGILRVVWPPQGCLATPGLSGHPRYSKGCLATPGLSGHPRVVWPPQGCLATPGLSGHPRVGCLATPASTSNLEDQRLSLESTIDQSPTMSPPA